MKLALILLAVYFWFKACDAAGKDNNDKRSFLRREDNRAAFKPFSSVENAPTAIRRRQKSLLGRRAHFLKDYVELPSHETQKNQETLLLMRSSLRNLKKKKKDGKDCQQLCKMEVNKAIKNINQKIKTKSKKLQKKNKLATKRKKKRMLKNCLKKRCASLKPEEEAALKDLLLWNATSYDLLFDSNGSVISEMRPIVDLVYARIAEGFDIHPTEEEIIRVFVFPFNVSLTEIEGRELEKLSKVSLAVNDRFLVVDLDRCITEASEFIVAAFVMVFNLIPGIGRVATKVGDKLAIKVFHKFPQFYRGIVKVFQRTDILTSNIASLIPSSAGWAVQKFMGEAFNAFLEAIRSLTLKDILQTLDEEMSFWDYAAVVGTIAIEIALIVLSGPGYAVKKFADIMLIVVDAIQVLQSGVEALIWCTDDDEEPTPDPRTQVPTLPPTCTDGINLGSCVPNCSGRTIATCPSGLSCCLTDVAQCISKLGDLELVGNCADEVTCDLDGPQVLLKSEEGPCSDCCVTSPECEGEGMSGTCIDTVQSSTCDLPLDSADCSPLGSSFKCCVSSTKSCSYGDYWGECMDESRCAGKYGVSIAGLCIGGSNIRCCFTGLPTGFCVSDDRYVGTCMDGGTCNSLQETPLSNYQTPGYSCPASQSCCVAPPTCQSSGLITVTGVCLHQSEIACHYEPVSNQGCPGNSDIQCCLNLGAYNPCETQGMSGTCMDKDRCVGDDKTVLSGVCPGNAEIKCCADKIVSGDSCPSGLSEHCANGSCAYNSSDVVGSQNPICCPSGSLQWFGDHTVCVGRNPGQACFMFSDCDSGICSGGLCLSDKIPDGEPCPSGNDSNCKSEACGYNSEADDATLTCCQCGKSYWDTRGVRICETTSMDCCTDSDCESDSRCMDGICKLANGEPCPSGLSEDCANGSCAYESIYVVSLESPVCCPSGALRWFDDHTVCFGPDTGQACYDASGCHSSACSEALCVDNEIQDGGVCRSGLDSDCKSGACGYDSEDQNAILTCCPCGRISNETGREVCEETSFTECCSYDDCGGEASQFRCIGGVCSLENCTIDYDNIMCCGVDDCGANETCSQNKCIFKGNPRFALMWFGDDDLDLHVITPGGFHIYYGAPSDFYYNSGGELDQDIIPVEVGANIENVNFPEDGTAPRGDYIYFVHNFNDGGDDKNDRWVLNVYLGEVLVTEERGITYLYENSTLFCFTL